MEEPLNIERDMVKNGVRLDCVFEGYEYRPEREEVRSQRLAGFECVEIAENTGLSLEQVTDYCRELGLPETGSCQLQPPDGSGGTALSGLWTHSRAEREQWSETVLFSGLPGGILQAA